MTCDEQHLDRHVSLPSCFFASAEEELLKADKSFMGSRPLAPPIYSGACVCLSRIWV